MRLDRDDQLHHVGGLEIKVGDKQGVRTDLTRELKLKLARQLFDDLQYVA